MNYIKKTLKIILITYFTILFTVIGINQFIYYTGYFENASVADNKTPVKFYAINLDRQPEKFAKLKAQTDKYGIELTRFSAIDGYKITLVDKETKEVFHGVDAKQKGKFQKHHKYDVYCTSESYEQHQKPEFVYEAFKNYHRPLSPGELGLLCSARILWHQISDSPTDTLSVIFEDDALLYPDFDKNLKALIESLPNKWDLAYLDGQMIYNDVNKRRPRSWSNIFRFPEIAINNTIIKVPPAIDLWGTYGYVVNKNSANKLLALQTEDNAKPLDNLFVDGMRYRKLIAYVSKKEISSYDRLLPSDITAMGGGR